MQVTTQKTTTFWPPAAYSNKPYVNTNIKNQQERIKFQGRPTSHSKLLSVARLDEPTLSCLFRGTSYVSAAATPNFDFPLHPPLRTRDRLRLISIEVETDNGKQCERLETWLM